MNTADALKPMAYALAALVAATQQPRTNEFDACAITDKKLAERRPAPWPQRSD